MIGFANVYIEKDKDKEKDKGLKRDWVLREVIFERKKILALAKLCQIVVGPQFQNITF